MCTYEAMRSPTRQMKWLAPLQFLKKNHFETLNAQIDQFPENTNAAIDNKYSDSSRIFSSPFFFLGILACPSPKPLGFDGTVTFAPPARAPGFTTSLVQFDNGEGPHNAAFPRKLAAPNFVNASTGTAPASSLLLRSSSLRLGGKSGTSLESWLFWRRSVSNAERFAIPGGMVPSRLLSERSRRTRHGGRDPGMGPKMSLRDSYKRRRLGNTEFRV